MHLPPESSGWVSHMTRSRQLACLDPLPTIQILGSGSIFHVAFTVRMTVYASQNRSSVPS